jgi:hypothetical protein
MSYSLRAYLVTLDEVRRTVGSRDSALVKAIVDYHPEAFAEEPDPDDEEIPLAQALEELVAGEFRHPNSAHQYGYALEEVCDYLGEELPSDCWCDIRWICLKETGMERVFDQVGCPVKLPPNPGSFPAIGHLAGDAIGRLLAELGDGHLTHEDEEFQEMLDEYEDWLRTAAAQGKDLIFFYS